MLQGKKSSSELKQQQSREKKETFKGEKEPPDSDEFNKMVSRVGRKIMEHLVEALRSSGNKTTIRNNLLTPNNQEM